MAGGSAWQEEDEICFPVYVAALFLSNPKGMEALKKEER